MKKILLAMMAIAVSMTTMAKQQGITPVSKSVGVSINLPKMVNNDTYKSATERNAAMNAFYSDARFQRNAVKASKRAEEINPEEAIPTYAMSNYVYTDVTGPMYMPFYDGASYIVKDNKVYFAPFDGLDFIEGEIIKGNNTFAEADSITFTISSQEVGEDKAGTKYYIGMATLNTQTYDLTRNTKTTFGAYYFPEKGEIYVPLFTLDDFVCLFAENATTPEFGYAIANLDIMPQDYLSEYFYTGSFTATDATSEEPTSYSGKVKAFISENSIFVKGINSPISLLKDSWMEFETGEDLTSATLSYNQLLGIAELYTDDTYTTTAQVAFTPVGALSDFSDFTSDYSSSYFLEVNNNKLIIASTGMDFHGVYAMSKTKDYNGGVIWMSDLQIIINLEGGDEEEMEITTSKDGYATFFDSQSAYSLPQGLVAQTVSGVADGKLILTTLMDGIIPANTAVILSSETEGSNTFTLTATDEAARYAGTNLLYGSDEPTWTTGPNNCYFYKLTYGATGSNLEDLFGWYWGAANGGAFQIEGHKAWLAVPMSAGARYFVNNETDGIMAIDKVSTNNDVVFDMQGRRMGNTLTKGLYIKNGKKIVNM